MQKLKNQLIDAEVKVLTSTSVLAKKAWDKFKEKDGIDDYIVKIILVFAAVVIGGILIAWAVSQTRSATATSSEQMSSMFTSSY